MKINHINKKKNGLLWLGRQHDKDGNLVQWWSDKVISSFKEQTQCLINQYGNFTLPEADGLNVSICVKIAWYLGHF
jgi:predicted metalloendopeptidase